MGQTPPHPNMHNPLAPMAGPAPGGSELGWERVPRGPVTRELALEASGLHTLFLPWEGP